MLPLKSGKRKRANDTKEVRETVHSAVAHPNTTTKASDSVTKNHGGSSTSPKSREGAHLTRRRSKATGTSPLPGEDEPERKLKSRQRNRSQIESHRNDMDRRNNGEGVRDEYNTCLYELWPRGPSMVTDCNVHSYCCRILMHKAVLMQRMCLLLEFMCLAPCPVHWCVSHASYGTCILFAVCTKF